MGNLLSSNLFHLRRSKAFWAALLFMAGYGLVEAVGLWRQGGNLSGGLFAGLAYQGIALAVFCGLYLGTEYSDGTVRNKVSAGYRRGRIYGAYLLACLLGGLGIFAAYLLAYLAAGLPLLGWEPMAWGQVLWGLLGGGLLTLTCVSLYTCLACLIQTKATVAAAVILLAFALFFGGMYVYTCLDEPAFSAGQAGELPNPKYLRGTQRQVYEVVYDLLPQGQAMQILTGGADTPRERGAQTAAALAVAAVTSGLGAAGFGRKNLK